jgi:aminopeptidase N
MGLNSHAIQTWFCGQVLFDVQAATHHPAGAVLCCAALCMMLPQATFVVEVEAPSDLTVLSNSPAASTRWILNSASSSVSRTTFQPTPVMSTYLLSIAVGELKSVQADTSR